MSVDLGKSAKRIIIKEKLIFDPIDLLSGVLDNGS